jgi:hypothetical protein
MTISASHSDAIVLLLQMNASDAFFVRIVMDELCGHVHDKSREFSEDGHGSENEGTAFGFDTSHTLTIKRTPGAFAFVTGNGEVAAADDAGLLQGMASAFHFLRVTRVELQGTGRAVSLDELHADDAGASGEDKSFDLVGFVHGKKEGEALASLHHDCAFGCVCPALEPLALLMAKPASFSRRIVTSGFYGADQGLQTVASQCLDFLSLSKASQLSSP